MNSQIKELWVNALRSGEYQQGTGNLRSISGYCCLGVLCDLYSKEHNQGWEFRGNEETNIHPQDYWCFYGENKFLPVEVMNWAGLTSECPEIVYCDIEDDEELNYTNTVAELNDDGMNFHQIADLIEEQL